jgi:hypothetical protein
MADLEKHLNSTTQDHGARGGAERIGDHDDLIKLAREEKLSLRDSDDTTVEPESLICQTQSHTSGHTLGLSRSESKKTYVDFAHNDPENPLNFSKPRKLLIMFLTVTLTVLVAMAAGAYSPAIPDLMREFGVSREVATLGISLYPLGCISSYCRIDDSRHWPTFLGASK